MTTLDQLLANLTIVFIKLYQHTLSPDKGIFSPVLKGRICSHQPHCSEYAIKTLNRYGFRKGIGKATDRVLHCKPRMTKHYDPAYYRVVFFSSAPIGVPFLEELAKDKRFELVGVVTQADKPLGRGWQMQENIIKKVATSL
ncbi:MAG: membrane protein insertion efficiency factor YidD [Candidatus Peribacteria bacterium]|jgi:putative membrane protein insertion efficiency factor|nr:membrane protein insertion efficiency factor YidD [Candidatus Peribacteria bacterium]